MKRAASAHTHRHTTHTRTHIHGNTPAHTNIPWQTGLPLPPPILPLHLLPSGVLLVCVCVCVFFASVCVCVWVYQSAHFCYPQKTTGRGRMVEWGCVCLPCLSRLCVCMLVWSSVTCGCVYVWLFGRQANSGKLSVCVCVREVEAEAKRLFRSFASIHRGRTQRVKDG